MSIQLNEIFGKGDSLMSLLIILSAHCTKHCIFLFMRNVNLNSSHFLRGERFLHIAALLLAFHFSYCSMMVKMLHLG